MRIINERISRSGLNENEEDTPGPGELQVLLNLKGGVGISLITRKGYSQYAYLYFQVKNFQTPEGMFFKKCKF